MDRYVFIIVLHMLFLFHPVTGISFQLSDNPSCFQVGPGSYELEYLITSSSDGNASVAFIVEDYNETVLHIIDHNAFQGQFVIATRGRMCFWQKYRETRNSVSLDFLEKTDPLGRIITDQGVKEAHNALFQSFQSLERVYRDQHFLFERNKIYRGALDGINFWFLILLMGKVGFVVLITICHLFVTQIRVNRFLNAPRIDAEEDTLM